MKNWKYLPVASLLAAPLIAGAQSSVNIYGLVDLGVAVQNLGNGRSTSMVGVSYPSRIGFKGTEDMGGGLKANFQLEADINVDTGAGNAAGGLAFTRISTVGLEGSFGRIDLGRTYTPAFLAVLNHDYSGYAYYNSTLVFTAIPGGATTRYSNGIFYTSPNWSGLTVRAAMSLGERTATPKDVGNTFGMSAVYAKDNLGLDAYYQADKVGLPVGSAAPTSAASKVQAGLGGRYTIAGVRLLAGYGQVKTDGLSDKVTGTNVGFVFPVGQGEIMGQLTKLKADAATGEKPSALAWGATYRYFLSKRTTLYTTAGQTRNNSTGNFALFTTVPNLPSSVGAQPKGFAVGIAHTF